MIDEVMRMSTDELIGHTRLLDGEIRVSKLKLGYSVDYEI